MSLDLTRPLVLEDPHSTIVRKVHNPTRVNGTHHEGYVGEGWTGIVFNSTHGWVTSEAWKGHRVINDLNYEAMEGTPEWGLF